MKSKCGAALLLMLVLVMACAGALADYTVTFNANEPKVTNPSGGTITIPVTGMPDPATVNVPIGDTVDQPENPTATGYVFGGWYTDVNCTSAYDFETPVQKSFTLYAKWMLAVTFHANAPTVIDPVTGASTPITVAGMPNPATVPIGATVGQPENPTAVGYTFEGWYTSANCLDKEKYDFTTKVMSALNLYAKWTQKKYTVTFDLQDATITPKIPDQTVNHGAKVTKPDDPTKDGYTFGGWYKEPTCATKFTFTRGQSNETVTQNIKLYAKWSINQYEVTFDNKGHGIQPPKQMVNYNKMARNPGDLVEQGYRFGGWYTNLNDPSTAYHFTEKVTSNVTLYAKWTKQHTVKFNLNGHGAVIKPVTVDHGGNVSAPTAPTAEGYDFVEWDWYGEPASTVLKKFKFKGEENADTVTRDIELVAKWTANVKVKFQWQTAITHDGDDPTGSATVQLMIDGQAATVEDRDKGVDQPSKTLAPSTTEQTLWEGLSAGHRYTVSATAPTNYTAVCTRTGENTFLVTYVENEKLTVSTITNKHEVDKIDMVISKFWDDNNNKHRPGSIQVQVKKVVESGTTNVGSPITLNDSNQWTAHVTDLYMRENGKTIQYIIEEVGDVKGYKATCEIVVDAQGNYTVRVTNVLTGKLDLEGWKKWDDDNDRDGIRPQSVQLKIYENSISPPTTLVKNVIVDASTANPNDANMWKWTVEDLPVYDKFGSPITYIVVEDPVPAGYTASDPVYITVGTTP